MRDPARILVVDDVADNVEILRMRLSALGYEHAGVDPVICLWNDRGHITP